MKHKLLFIRSVLAFFALMAGAGASSGQKIETGFLNRSITFNGSEYRYVVYVPREFSHQQSYPVSFALHCGGQYGSDGLKQTEIGLAKAIRLTPERFPVIVLFPQAKADVFI